MTTYDRLAKDIIEAVGGKENILSLTHCVTRLRFQLQDETKAQDSILKNMDGVITVMKSAGQYQVVIGNHVKQVYETILPLLELEGAVTTEVPVKKKFFDAILDTISGIFQPVLGIMTAAGMLKGFNALFQSLHWYSSTDGFSIFMNTIGDAFFLYFPIILGYTSAKKFKLNPFLGLVIGAALCYPAIQSTTLATMGEPLYTLLEGTPFVSPVYTTIFGIPLIALDYTSTVVPVILVTFMAAKVEKIFNRYTPQNIKFFFVPMVTIFISLFFGFLIIGPVATFLAKFIANAMLDLRALSPTLAGFLIGGLWQILVIFGIHWGLLPIYINNIATMGFDNIMAPFFATTFAQTAVVLAIYCKTKDKKMKEMALPAAISGFFGITEPAIYGITLPMKKPFIISCIASAIVGAYYGFANLSEFIVGGIGIFEFPSFIQPGSSDLSNMMIAAIGVIIAVIISFIATFLLYKDKEVSLKEKVSQVIEGEVIPLEKVEDEAFAKGLMGDGLAINPRKGEVKAPFSGVVSALFPTKHAIGLTSDNGLEVLIHVGMNTVQLGGKYFESLVSVGDRVKAEQILLYFDIEKIEKEGYSLVTPVIITNTNRYASINKLGLTGGNILLEVEERVKQ